MNVTDRWVEDVTLADLVAASVEVSSGRVAVVFGDVVLTYAEFGVRVNRLARWLIGRGVGPDVLVGLAVERSVEMIVAMHAVVAAGGAYVPIDPELPVERIGFVVESAAPQLVLTVSAFVGVLPVGVDVVVLDGLDVGGLSGGPVSDGDRVAPLRSGNAAYVMFTSGSTGRPKGVSVSHGAIVNQLAWLAGEYGVGADDRVMARAPFTFDVSVWESFLPLAVGARLVVTRPGGHRELDYLAGVMVEHAISVAEFVPSVLAALVADGFGGALGSLRHLFAGGEELSPELAVALGSLTSAAVHNTYGPTEAAITTTAHRIVGSVSGVVPIGTPVWNTRGYVLDSRLRPVPVGVAGELYLDGAQLARGYHRRPDLTSDRFVANPFVVGARMYRTGDRVLWSAAGSLVYLGRSDFQVKIRGVRIELGEIESALGALPGVSGAVVVVHGGSRLVGYVTVASSVGSVGSVDSVGARAAVGLVLPSYMVPDVVVVVDEFPLSSAGKLDRKALPEPVFGSRVFRAPGSASELVVAAAFAVVLGCESRVGVDDDFFVLGGNSLNATRLISRINQHAGTALPLRALFDHPSVVELAAALDNAERAARPALLARTRPERIPLSLAQNRMWFLNQYDVTSAAYNIPLAIRLSGAVDVSALGWAVGDVLARHESLRTMFPDNGDGPVQAILTPEEVEFDVSPIEVDRGDLDTRILAVLSEGFDVTASVPIRVKLFRLEESEHVLVMSVHHISADGVSMTPLARDVMIAYSARLTGQAPFWAPLEIQYADFALWQRALLGDEADPNSIASAQIDYWKTALDGIPDALELPTDRPRPAVATQNGAMIRFDIAPDVMERVRAIADHHHASVFMVVHAVFAALLARLSATSDIVVGTPVSGRGEASVDDLIGMFVGTVVLRTDVDSEQTFSSLIDQVRDRDLSAFGHVDVPFERLVDVLKPVRSQSHSPLFQVALAYEYVEDTAFELPDLRVSALEFDVTPAQFDLALTLFESVDDAGEATADSVAVRGSLTYATDLFDRSTVESVAEKFVMLLEQLTEDPASVIGDVDILNRDEQNLLAPVRGLAAAHPVTLSELIHAAVSSNPMGIAFLWNDRAVTYAEADELSTRLAHVIAERNAAPETFVALALPRSLESVLAVWAVAKTGAAYLPVDPSYPADRVAYILGDSRARLGVTIAEQRRFLPDDVEWLVLEDIADELAAASLSPIDAPARVDNPAYMIYTSGSTGMPKGVVVTHSGLANLAAERREHYRITSDARFLHTASPSFDMAVGEMISALSAAATLVIAPVTTIGGDDLAELLDTQRVTHALITPAVLSTIDPRDHEHLRILGVGGEAVSADLVDRWQPGRTMLNGYGPTEATDISTVADLVAGQPVTIGTPVRGFRAMILDTRLRPVPIGTPGELYVAGPALARGYHSQHLLTAARFVADPFGEPGQRMYRTGDIAAWTNDLTVEYHGRIDSQVKIRGHRIELGEIETTATRCDEIAQSVVLVVETALGKRLAIYLVPEAGRVIDVEAVRHHLESTLPRPMVPDAYVVLDALPVTVNGKLDRKALPTPTFSVPKTQYRAPGSETEETLASLFADLLGVETVSVDDSFFGLGGDSIASIQLVSRAKAHGLVMTPRDVFEQKTVAALAQVVLRADVTAREVLAELPGNGVGELPLTPVMRMVLGSTDHFDRYSQSIALDLPVGVDEQGIVDTLAAVVDHHDMLRSTLHSDTLQVAEPGSVDVAARLRKVDFDPTVVASAEGLTELARSEVELARRELDPRGGVMFACVWLAPTGEPEAATGRLLVVMHHLVVDGVSWRILVPDFMTAWAQISNGAPAQLAPVGTSMRRWAHALQDSGAAATAELPVWRSIVDGEDPDLGSASFDPSVDLVDTVRDIEVRVDASTTRALLTEVPAAFRGGVNDGLLTALALAVTRWRRERGVHTTSTLIQMEGHGREEHTAPGADLSRTVGWFTSVYPVRLELGALDIDDAMSGGAAAGRAVKSIKEQLLAVPGRGIGYGVLRYLTGSDHCETLQDATPQISFNYLGRVSAGSVPDEFAELGWTPSADVGDIEGPGNPDMPAAAVLDINAIVTDTSDESTGGASLSATFSYAGRLLTEADVRDLAEYWTIALRSLVSHVGDGAGGGLTPSDVPLVTASQEDIDAWEERYPVVGDIWPLSPLQHGLAFHSLLAGNTADVYQTQMVLELTGTVDPVRMNRAVTSLLNRHDNLRTAYVTDLSGELAQIVLGETDIPWRVVDLGAVPESEREVAYDRALERDRSERFDLATPPLLRFTLITQGPGRHALAVTLHHILLDGWSMPLLMKDLMVLYATRGDESVLPRAASYRNYLAWLSSRDTAESELAWAEALSGLEQPTLFAGQRTVGSSAGTVESVVTQVETELAQQLGAFSADNGVTLNTMMQAGWGILLARQLGRTDVVFGATVSGRPPELDQVESMVGLFINTLPVRVTLDPAESLRSLLSRLQVEQAGLLEHHHLGLTDIVKSVGNAADFDTLTVFESYPVDAEGIAATTSIDGMTVTAITGEDATHYPLTLTVVADNGIEFTLKYQSDVFDASTIRVVRERMLRILRALVELPDTAVGNLDVLGAYERRLLVPVSGLPAAPQSTWADLVDSAVARNPEGIAIWADGRAWTYREADAWSNRLARILLDQGVGPETFVAVALRRSAASVMSVWAVTKTGAAYLPVDPDYPVERIEHMITDSGAVIGISRGGNHLPDSVRWLDLDALETAIDDLSDSRIVGAARVDNPAYMIYTSGSTGKPKGVVVTHGGLANLAAERREHYRVDSSSRFLHNTSPSFDMSVGEMMSALSAAATLVVTPPTILGGEELSRFMIGRRVTHALITPAMLTSMEPEGLEELRVLGVGGEAVSAELVNRWQPGRTMLNGYGPTEATDISTVGDLVAGNPVTIGSPVRGFDTLILDARLLPVPIGTPGELYVSGPALARGYHDQSVLTATRFVANPHGRPGDRLYRTGDIAAWTPELTIEYQGRTDSQVKIRGHRIELGEIDAALHAHPDVDVAMTLGKRTPSGDTALVAYVVPAQGTAPEVGQVIAFVSEFLPRHMIPSAVVFIDKVPTTPTGKVDEKALPTPEFASTIVYREPSTPTEIAVATAFSEVLEIADVGGDDNFFELGGNSLSAMRVVTKLRASLAREIPLQWLMTEPTPASIASRVDSGQESAGALDVVFPIRTTGDRPPVFFVHPIVGLAWSYAGLTPYIDSATPMYGIQTPAVSSADPLPTSIELTAARYLEEVRLIQPEGPYHLAGWSLGGVIAHAMAVQLQTAGESVDSLVMLDSFAYSAEDTEGSDAGDDADMGLEFAQAMGELTSEDVGRLVFAAQHNDSLMQTYRPGIFDGDILYFTAALDDPWLNRGADSWRAYVSGDIVNHPVECTHWNITSPTALETVGPLMAHNLERIRRMS
ncbi:amino acid adenylation domain-containing protein [Rhodococcus sp. KBW08]|uniref:amino acid adenylation domain-containing protein n=2 Tax=unclassified Rhodococcus (in: high G+C Gram-positive bacteria) TaxID=192944 RepID=UPI0021AAA550|nr:non-ribosomal peptide synthetase [Rhodococcus sp. KBW08]